MIIRTIQHLIQHLRSIPPSPRTILPRLSVPSALRLIVSFRLVLLGRSAYLALEHGDSQRPAPERHRDYHPQRTKPSELHVPLWHPVMSPGISWLDPLMVGKVDKVVTVKGQGVVRVKTRF
jgi:hypothetical protein